MPFGPSAWARQDDLPDFRVSASGSALPVGGAVSIGEDVYVPYSTNLISVVPDDGMVYLGGGIVRCRGNDRFTSYNGGSSPSLGTDSGGALTRLRRDSPFGSLANINGVPFALIGGHSVSFVSVWGISGPGQVLIAANWGPLEFEDPDAEGSWTVQQVLYDVPAKFQGIPGGAGFMTLDGSFFNIGDTWYCLFGLAQGTGGTLGTNETFHAAIWRSLDFGRTWSLFRDLTNISPFGSASLPNQTVGVNRSGLERMIMVFTNFSVWWSDDLGATWTEASGNNINAQKLMFLSSGGMLLGRRGGLSVSTGANVSCDLGESWTQGVAEPTGNNNTRIGIEVIGLEEAIAAVPGGTGVLLFWSNNGGERFVSQGEFTDISNTSLLMDMVLVDETRDAFLYNQGRQVLRSNAQPTGTVSPRSICPGIAAGLAAAGPLRACGLPVMVNNCP